MQITGDATGQVYQLDATFKLVNVANGKVVLQGKAMSRAAYNRYQEIFANVRARYDAENRAARTVAESIKTRSPRISATRPRLPASPPSALTPRRRFRHGRLQDLSRRALRQVARSRRRAVLVYGPDAGLVAERAAALAQKFARQGKGRPRSSGSTTATSPRIPRDSRSSSAPSDVRKRQGRAA